MTDEELKQDRALIDAAVDAPWEAVQESEHRWLVLDGNGMWVADCGNDEKSAKMIAAARTRWSAALAEIAHLTVEYRITMGALDLEAKDARNILAKALVAADGEHSSSLVDCASRAADLVIECVRLRAEIDAMRPVVDAAVGYCMAPSACWQSEARIVEAAGLYHAKRHDITDTGRHREPDWDAKDAAGAKDGGGPA